MASEAEPPMEEEDEQTNMNEYQPPPTDALSVHESSNLASVGRALLGSMRISTQIFNFRTKRSSVHVIVQIVL